MSAGSAAASTAALGNSRSSPVKGVAMGAPKRCTRRWHSVRAAATLTCWPSTTRTAVSKPSQLPGRRMPARAGPGTLASTGSMAAGSASRQSMLKAL